ncbi:MAG: hypothetical protein WCJ19_04945 [bacterium]
MDGRTIELTFTRQVTKAIDKMLLRGAHGERESYSSLIKSALLKASFFSYLNPRDTWEIQKFNNGESNTNFSGYFDTLTPSDATRKYTINKLNELKNPRSFNTRLKRVLSSLVSKGEIRRFSLSEEHYQDLEDLRLKLELPNIAMVIRDGLKKEEFFRKVFNPNKEQSVVVYDADGNQKTSLALSELFSAEYLAMKSKEGK